MKRMTWIGIVPIVALIVSIGVLTTGWAAGKTATIRGKVVFKGTPPKPQPVSFGAELQCKQLRKNNPLYKEDIVVNKNGTLRWVLVYVKSNVKGKFQPPKDPVVVDQIGCQFIPHVAAAMVGQPVEFRNSDALLHNVRADSETSQSFNLAQPVAGMKEVRTFKKPELGIELKCDVHFWMLGYLHILPHPFFAVTGEDGTFTIQGLPPGKYTLEAWHEKLGTQTAEVTVKAGEVKEVTFTFSKE